MSYRISARLALRWPWLSADVDDISRGTATFCRSRSPAKDTGDTDGTRAAAVAIAAEVRIAASADDQRRKVSPAGIEEEQHGTHTPWVG